MFELGPMAHEIKIGDNARKTPRATDSPDCDIAKSGGLADPWGPGHLSRSLGASRPPFLEIGSRALGAYNTSKINHLLVRGGGWGVGIGGGCFQVVLAGPCTRAPVLKTRSQVEPPGNLPGIMLLVGGTP